MRAWLLWAVALMTFAAVAADVNVHAARTRDPLDFNGVADLQVVIEDSISVLDAVEPSPCFAEWMLAERMAMRHYALALRAHAAGDVLLANDAITAHRVTRWLAGGHRRHVSCWVAP